MICKAGEGSLVPSLAAPHKREGARNIVSYPAQRLSGDKTIVGAGEQGVFDKVALGEKPLSRNQGHMEEYI